MVFQLSQLSNILLGQQTETFKLLPSTSLALVSFSLVLDDRTLDCVAKSVRERLWWCAHIQHAHKALRPHGAKSIAESLRKQQQVMNDDYGNESCVFFLAECVCLFENVCELGAPVLNAVIHNSVFHMPTH